MCCNGDYISVLYEEVLRELFFTNRLMYSRAFFNYHNKIKQRVLVVADMSNESS